MSSRLPATVFAATLTLFATATAACGALPTATAALLPAEKMTLPASGGLVQPDRAAPDGKALKIWSNATATGRITTPATVQVSLSARGEACQGAPVARLTIDGRVVGSASIAAGAYRSYTFAKVLSAGPHTVQVALINDHAMGYCDRNVWLDSVRFDKLGTAPGTPTTKPTPTPTTKPSPTPTTTRTPAPSASPSPTRTPSPAPTRTPSPTPTRTPSPSPSVTPSPSLSTPAPTTPAPGTPAPTTPAPTTPAPGSNPFAGATLFVDPNSTAAGAARQLRPVDPASAALLQKIADRPQADWYGDWNSTGMVAAQVSARVSQVTAAGDLPVLVTYAIPSRDCNGYSAGGASGASAYHDWIEQFAVGIGGREAAVVLEPDALAQLDCLSADAQTARLAELRDAVKVLSTSPNVSIYLDAGHSGWQSVTTMAARLQSVSNGKVRGFSLNVSGFGVTSAELAYGEQLAQATGLHYVIDTSRNGLGPATSFCNPPGEALGTPPTWITAADSADAYLWIKHPGESDGECGRGDPPAGTWSNALAEDLASRAAF